MAKYHVNHEGNVGLCRADLRCPFGGEAEHYETKAEAHRSYEVHMNGLMNAKDDKAYSHLEDSKVTPNSSWNKFRKLKSEISPEANAHEAKEEMMEKFGPVELFYLSEKDWGDIDARHYAQQEIARRKEAAREAEPGNVKLGETEVFTLGNGQKVHTVEVRRRDLQVGDRVFDEKNRDIWTVTMDRGKKVLVPNPRRGFTLPTAGGGYGDFHAKKMTTGRS